MKKGIIIASFGTTYEETRKSCIESIENKIKEKYKDIYVIRAFTSQMVINILKKRDNIHIFNPNEALNEMKTRGIDDIYIQPLHIIAGHEYEKLLSLGVKVGKPLLFSEEDYKTIVNDLDIGKYNLDEALVFMGHGSDHFADNAYLTLEKAYRDRGLNNVYVGTVEGSRTIEDIIIKLKSKNVRKVKLMPFMLVAGDHVVNDMASKSEDSWKTVLDSEGFETEVILKGLGEYEVIQNIYLDHLNELMGGR